MTRIKRWASNNGLLTQIDQASFTMKVGER